jgi:exopolysaccharide biosynthesis protein
MKKLAATFIALSMLLSLLVTSASAQGAGTVVYRNTQQITNNLSYTNTIYWSDAGERQQSYALNLSGKGDAYPIIMKNDTIYGRMTVSDMVAYAKSQGKKVLAAVNTDFFYMGNGVPIGLVVENGVYKSSAEESTAVGFRNDGSVVFSDNPAVKITLTNDSSVLPDDAGKNVTLYHFNKTRVDNGGLYLFSSAFSTVSTRTTSPGWFVKFKILEGTPAMNGTMSLEVSEVTNDPAVTSVPIGDDYLVLTAAGACGMEGEAAKFQVGDKVTLKTECVDPNFTNVAWATGGGDILIRDGAITDQSRWDKQIDKKNPRTAFGVTADGTVISFVIDGREADNSAGLTLGGLAEEMLARGCIYAINLDGGGSSVMSIRLPGQSDCTVVNRPSDGSPRKVSTYILYVTDVAPDGVPRYLGLTNDGFEVLAGSSVDIGFLATDSGFMPVTAPGDIEVTSKNGLGTVSGSKYTAGPVHGVDTLILTSKSTGATGTATVHIIYDPTKLIITQLGSTQSLTALDLSGGDTLQLSASASYYNIPVYADPSAVKYTIEGNIGTVDETGLFTANYGGNLTGLITVSVGGCSKTIPVTVTGFVDTAGHWARDYIKNLSKAGIVNGVTADTYAPELTLKRGDFVLMLWRAAGKPTPAGTTTFSDIKPEDYYAQAISWAEGLGIAKGSGDGLFNPQGTLTREQAFTLVYRSLPTLGKACTDAPTDILGGFADSGSVSSWAATPTSTLVSMGIVSGAYGQITPADAMTRAQMAKILDSVLRLA